MGTEVAPEGLPFSLTDLKRAVNWGRRSGVPVVIGLDHQTVPEAIEIAQMAGEKTRWCLWRDHLGDLHVDDWQMKKFDLPYSTVTEALRMITPLLKAERRC